MITFLFEQYGYYPKDIKGNTFEINGWVFKLIEVDCNENYIAKIFDYALYMRENFNGIGPFLIKTRNENNVSFFDGKKYVLISIEKKNFLLSDLNYFHCKFIETEKEIDLKKILSVWQERTEIIESEMIKYLRIDSIYYKDNIEHVMLCLGLAQNALQYLSETIFDHGDKISNVTVCHKRLKDLNSFDFLNPFNFIVDHPIRDLAELYRNDFLQFDDLVMLLNYYKLDSQLASFFMARLLYPFDIFDLLEDKTSVKNEGFRIKLNAKKELLKISKVYLYLKEKYNIRPIDWLES